MQQYNFNIEYIKGEDNIPADGFSRLMERTVSTDKTVVETPPPIVEPLSHLVGRKRVRWEDEGPIPVHPDDELTATQSKRSRRDVADDANGGDAHGRVSTEQPRGPIPEDAQEDSPTDTKLYKRVYYKIISKCHNSEVGHMGVDKTILRLHNWNEVKNLTEPWKHMRRNVKHFIHECEFVRKWRYSSH